MTNNEKVVFRLAIDLKRSVEDIKENMTMGEFKQWVEYYKDSTSIETLSIQLAKLTELFYKTKFEGDVTIFDFLPNTTETEKNDALILYKQSKIDKAMKEFR